MQYPTNILDAQFAIELLAVFDENPVNKILSFVGFDLLTFDGITDEAASVIAGCNLDPLYLDSLKFLSAEAARRLACFRGDYLSLCGLEEISPEVAAALAEYRGSVLSLSGLTDLTPEVAVELSAFPNLLTLNGIMAISVATAAALVPHRGDLILDGLLHLPEDVAEALSRHDGKSLSLESLRFMSDGAAKALAGYRGRLEMVVDGECVTDPNSSP
ncbi:MAG: hypothetical protein NT013_30620 [Planctomycetia bacterium]|nr:hypothetical protein [Planctomycetia bacterium]